MVHRIERQKKAEINSINDTLNGNYWTGGEGYGMGSGAAVSNLLYDPGAKGGKVASKANEISKIVVGHGRKNPNQVKRKY